MDLDNHPSVIESRRKAQTEKPRSLSREWLKSAVLEAGADDAGVAPIDHPTLKDQKAQILYAFPQAKTVVAFACRMNTPQLRSPDRSLADHEFITLDKEMPAISRKIVRRLMEKGVSAITPSEGFPQDMNLWPGRMFTVSHKLAAEAAGLGKIGHHRLVIHPVFGSHISLGTLIIDSEMDSYDTPVDFNPCVSCGLCVRACPTGAICKDGSFNFFSCLIHAYRERIGGFLDWTEALVTSNTMDEYRKKRNDSETLAVWQSLTYGGGYRCGYCMSVCPAGSDLIGGFADSRSEYMNAVVNPLIDRKESVYIIPGPENEADVRKRFPNKTPRPV